MNCEHDWHLYKDNFNTSGSVCFICDKCGVYKSTKVLGKWLGEVAPPQEAQE